MLGFRVCRRSRAGSAWSWRSWLRDVCLGEMFSICEDVIDCLQLSILFRRYEFTSSWSVVVPMDSVPDMSMWFGPFAGSEVLCFLKLSLAMSKTWIFGPSQMCCLAAAQTFDASCCLALASPRTCLKVSLPAFLTIWNYPSSKKGMLTVYCSLQTTYSVPRNPKCWSSDRSF